MSRTFSKDTANYMSFGSNAIGPILHGKGACSIAMWVRAASISASPNQDRMFNFCNKTNQNGIVFTTDGSSHLRVSARSDDIDSAQIKDTTTAIATSGAWTHLAAVINWAGDSITPYLNGVAEGGGSVTFNSTSFQNGAHTTDLDSIGSGMQAGAPPATTAIQFDGDIAEFAIWSGDIGAAGMTMLGVKALNPLMVRSDLLEVYFPLHGNNSPERDIVAGLSGTITGTVAKAAHPRIRYPRGAQLFAPTTPSTGGPFPHYYYAQMRQQMG